MKVTSFILICVFSIHCFCKDIISISIDNDKPKNSNESEDKDIKIEISKAKNHSSENIIPISSYSGSLEQYEQTVLQGQEQSPWILLRNDKQKTDTEYDGKYSGRILSSIEETGDLWAETRKDSVYSAKMRSEPQSDNIFHHKRMNSFENLRKMPTVMSRNYPKIHEKISSSMNEQKNIPKDREDISFSQEEKTMHSNMRNKQLRGEKNVEVCNSIECKHSRNKEKIHNEIPISRGHSRNGQTNNNGYRNDPEEIPRSSENSRYVNIKRERLNVLQIAKSETQRTREKTESNNANESSGIAIASNSDNSSIEASKSSNHEYRANKNTEESEGNDEDTLDDYPYTISVQRKGAHYASGALVGERWILSTAAEFYNVRESIKLFRVRAGSLNCKKGGILTPIISIAIHPKFTPGLPAFDISALKTAEPLLLSPVIKPIGLSRVAGKVVSAKFLTTYWPRIVVKEGVVPLAAKERVNYNSMRVSTQKLVPTSECSKVLEAVNVTLDKNSLCLRTVRLHHSDCMPDVGAPVVAVDGLWGITSGWVSPQCPSVLLPTLFTRVTTLALRHWINEQMLIYT